MDKLYLDTNKFCVFVLGSAGAFPPFSMSLMSFPLSGLFHVYLDCCKSGKCSKQNIRCAIEVVMGDRKKKRAILVTF